MAISIILDSQTRLEAKCDLKRDSEFEVWKHSLKDDSNRIDGLDEDAVVLERFLGAILTI